MSHSIPDSRAVAIETALGTVLAHRRLQVRPDPGRRGAGGRLPARRARPRGPALPVRRLDQRRPPRRRPLGVCGRPGAPRGVRALRGRIIVTCFASNVHRVQQVIDAAAELDRRVALVGRSMRKNFNIASNLGIAHAPEGLLIPPKEIEDFPDHKVIAISTGSQGEPLSALRRMAFNDHRDVELHSGRHGDVLGHSDSGQRALGERDRRPHLRDRRAGGDRGGRADPRFRSRLAGGAEADAQPDEAALRASRPRRPPAPAPARRARRARSASTTIASSAAATGWRWRSSATGPAWSRRPTRA